MRVKASTRSANYMEPGRYYWEIKEAPGVGVVSLLKND